ncbi:hypothetical protein [Halolamina salifodinae]|uniref:Uncharacterized protein n=1 Tax=Halolamina salifodinae TaxID=1202767 RepID=A0A8T4GT77_9EURY|nr:hypothetical protein [Halolamina salifodinae]MBP1986089.1 hypothetical protein [Halolamina salifodinae]
MEITSSLWSALSAVAAVVAAAITAGLLFVADSPVLPAVGMALLATAFFALSALPRVRAHHAYGPLNVGFVAAMLALWFATLRVGPAGESAVTGLVGGLAAVGLAVAAVELYRYRRGGVTPHLG